VRHCCRHPLRRTPSLAAPYSSSTVHRPDDLERGASLAKPRPGVGAAGHCQAAPPFSATGVPPLCAASYGRRVKNICCKPYVSYVL
jgi:hypothetical protein